MIEFAKKFVAATDEVWRLQRGTDPECVFFQEMAEQGHYGGRPGKSRQGIYVCAANGKFLASINSNDAERVLATMKRGFAAWELLPAAARALDNETKVAPRHRWEQSFPEDGLHLAVTSRDLPQDGNPESPCGVRWNRDHVWFSKNEARNWLAEDPQKGQRHEVPIELVRRLARFSFVNNVHGEARSFYAKHVADSQFVTEVVERNASQIQILIRGTTRGERKYREHQVGVAARVLGSATYDVTSESFTEFELVAVGEKWGRRGRGPIGYVFQLADRDGPVIAPTSLEFYQADWVIKPGAG